MPPISLPSFSINLSLPLRHKQRKSSDRIRCEGGGAFISPQNSRNQPRSHPRLCFCLSWPQTWAASRRISRAEVASATFSWPWFRWRRGKDSLASRRNERSRCVLPTRSAFFGTSARQRNMKTPWGFVHRRCFWPHDSGLIQKLNYWNWNYWVARTSTDSRPDLAGCKTLVSLADDSARFKNTVGVTQTEIYLVAQFRLHSFTNFTVSPHEVWNPEKWKNKETENCTKLLTLQIYTRFLLDVVMKTTLDCLWYRTSVRNTLHCHSVKCVCVR